MRKFAKRILSLVLVLSVAFSMMIFATPTASAGAGAVIGKAIAKKAIELGVRFSCAAAVELADSAEDDDASIIVKSFIQFIVCDGTAASVNEVKAMCKQILSEMLELKTDIKEYTSVISSALDKISYSNAKNVYNDKWAEDVTDVINPKGADMVSVNDALNAYMQYYIVSSVNANGMPKDEQMAEMMKSFWKDRFKTEFSEAECTDAKVQEYKDKMEYEFLEIYTGKSINESNAAAAREKAYNSAYVYLTLTSVIDELVDNYLADDVGTNGKVYTVVDCAATDAYYTLPFGFQQRDFIEAAAKDQIMMVTFMEMCLNEYLALQGTYLSETKTEGWNTEETLTYFENAGTTGTMSYAECLNSYQTLINRDLEEAVNLMEAEYRIDSSAYTANTEDIKVTLDDFMPIEDVQRVALTVNGYETKHGYYEDYENTEIDRSSWWFKDNVKYADKIPNKMYFYRVAAGNTSGTVYYILDPAQFGTTLDITTLSTHIKRIPTAGYDEYVGDIYPVSVDYYNAIKTMSDGTNNFHVPKSENATKDLASLINIPYFSARNGFNLKEFLNPFLPQTNMTPYLLTATYNNNFGEGLPRAVKEASINLVNLTSTMSNDYKVEGVSTKINQQTAGNGYYTLVLVNENEQYKQKATLKVDDNYSAVSSAQVSYSGGTITSGKSAVIESGTKVKVSFGINNVNNFDCLKMIRKNATSTETVLINGKEELEFFKNDDGTYSYDIAMPYSEVEFVVVTQEAPSYNVTMETTGPEDCVKDFALIYADTYETDREATVVGMGETGKAEKDCDVMLKFSLPYAANFESIEAEIDGKTSVILDKEGFDALYRNGYTYQYFKPELTNTDVTYRLNVTKGNTQKVSVRTEDPGNHVGHMYAEGPLDTVYTGSPVYFKTGAELSIRFALLNELKFVSLVQVNESTKEITVLADKDSLYTLEKDNKGLFVYPTVVPSYDVEYIVVTEEPEVFEPVEIEQDQDGTYIIKTYEDLRSVAYNVNNDIEGYPDGNYLLANDINVLGRTLEPIGSMNSVAFTGTFEGGSNTISNMKFESENFGGSASLFGLLGANAEVRNLNLKGSYTVNHSGDKNEIKIAPLVTYASTSAKIQDIQTDLDYKINGYNELECVSGFVYSASQTTFERCIVRNNINLPDVTTKVYAGYVTNGSGETYIDCADVSVVNMNITTGAYGFTQPTYYDTFTFNNCYSATTLNGGTLAPFTEKWTLGAKATEIVSDNCYYLDSTAGDNEGYALVGTAVEKDKFESGEITYKLNKGVTDSTQVWYQNVDNGNPVDEYPVFEGGIVYRSAGTCIKEGDGYTNVVGEISHNYNKYHVCKDCIGLRPGEAAGIYGFSIGLGGNISVKYYMVLDEDVAKDDSAMMVFTVPDTGSSYTVEIPVSEAEIYGKFHIFECEVAAKEMTSDIYCQVVTDSRTSDLFDYRVKDYAEVILENSDVYSKEVPLVKAMLNYGAAAQLAFDYNTDNLANTSDYITEEEKVLPAVDFSSYERKVEGTQPGVTYHGSAISLKSETAIKHYFLFENDEDVANIPVTVDGEKATLVKNGGYYELKITDIPAHRLHVSYEVKVGALTLNYSVFSYCCTVAGNVQNPKLADVAKALYAYNQAAIEYIG